MGLGSQSLLGFFNLLCSNLRLCQGVEAPLVVLGGKGVECLRQNTL